MLQQLGCLELIACLLDSMVLGCEPEPKCDHDDSQLMGPVGPEGPDK